MFAYIQLNKMPAMSLHSLITLSSVISRTSYT